MEVNDDSVVLKGGKGPWADEQAENGANERILIEDCTYGFCHSGLTCGSESVHNRNILVRRIRLNSIMQLLHLKLRPDTPQHYEYITIEDVEGSIEGSFINVNPWTQFFDLKGRTDKPISKVENITFKNCRVDCECFFNVSKDESQYMLSDFALENLQIRTQNKGTDFSLVNGLTATAVSVEEI